MLSNTKLEKIAAKYDGVTFVNTKKGRLVIFNVDHFIWNAYGKESFDSENVIPNPIWEQFLSDQKYLYLEKPENVDGEIRYWLKENAEDDKKIQKILTRYEEEY